MKVSRAARRKAEMHGKAFYETGKPCKHGHVTIRNTEHRHCRECKRLQSAAQRAATKLREKPPC